MSCARVSSASSALVSSACVRSMPRQAPSSSWSRSTAGVEWLLMQSLYRPAAAEPEGALVLLHGRGADERDLYPLLDALDPDRRLLGITPRAPLALPPGGAHWYRLGGIPTPDPGTFFATFAQAAGFLDGLPVPISRVVLGGFSQ